MIELLNSMTKCDYRVYGSWNHSALFIHSLLSKLQSTTSRARLALQCKHELSIVPFVREAKTKDTSSMMPAYMNSFHIKLFYGLTFPTLLNPYRRAIRSAIFSPPSVISTAQLAVYRDRWSVSSFLTLRLLSDALRKRMRVNHTNWTFSISPCGLQLTRYSLTDGI